MDLSNLHVLVVEDDHFQRTIAVEMLRSLGFLVISEVSNGHEALTVIRNATPKRVDLIFSDLRMPGMDGMEFLRHLSEEAHQMEIVILSAMDKKLLSVVNKISSLYQLKLLGVLEKPISLQKIKDILAKSAKAHSKTESPPIAPQIRQTFDFTVEEILSGIADGQFQPYLQPKVDLKTGRILGAEALARWLHPRYGIIAPYAFVPKLEAAEQIDTLTFSILAQSAHICRALQDKQHAMHIAVNLSLVSLSHPHITDKITSIVQAAGVDTRYITLEITESAAMTDAPIALENLARLYMNGFTLSIDDYGTGYSNLQQLTRIAFGELKIDQSFVQGVATNEATHIVVASNIDMAHKLNIKSVAEGVETLEDWEMLHAMHCDIGQGYFIAKPMQAEDFYHFMEQHRDQSLKSSPTVVQHYIQSKTKHNSQYRILVIDSNPSTRNTMLKTLQQLNYEQVSSVSSAEAAVETFKTQQFDLVITELNAPQVHGLELIKRIRTGKTLARPGVRIIIVSGLTQSKTVGVAITLNVNGFIARPLVADVVDRKIKEVMTASFQAQAAIAYETIHIEPQGAN